MNHFIEQLRQGNVEVLNVNLNENGPLIASLQNELHSQYNNIKLEQLVEGFKLYNGSWTRFNIMLKSFLRYCRDVNPWSLWESSDLIYAFYQDLSNCLLNDTYPLENLVQLFKDVTDWLLPMSIQLDANYASNGTRKNQFLQHVASVISRVFNSIKARVDESPTEFHALSAKQQSLLYVANKLNNIYFRLDSPSSCANIFKNIKPKSMLEHFHQYPIKERIEYRYLLGRYYLLNHRISDAFHQLNSSYRMLHFLAMNSSAPSHELVRNMVRVMRYLIPAGIILGKVPSFTFVDQIAPDLSHLYTKLIQKIKTGHVAGINEWLYTNEDYLRRKRLFIAILEKVPILAYRNLLKQVVQLTILPAESNRISYETMETALRVSLHGSQPQDGLPLMYSIIHTTDNAENVLVTLINHSFFRGNCFPLNRMCITMKTNNINDIFPPISDKIAAKFPLNSEDAWLDT
ncbi:HBR170Cp [Eremothecium sinecaudum]|uniref:HBR170Cp n=1 Tax=Eremothecium sinecaudum TaxID=45286 RepID=A0A125RE05_9SACH|nr:HBR170Cp [Eremothecium sinecaudum]AMD19071.1 HBR170Cp [Eremothecium sinecaudum]